MKNGLQKLRKNKKLTLTDVAKALGTSATTVCMYEHYQRAVPIEIVKAYAKVLGVSVAKLVDAYDEVI